MQARYYDPVIGRFYSNDPVDMLGHMQRGSPTMGFNRYAYANNNPYKYTDPDGKFGLIGAAIGAAVEFGAQMIKHDGDLSKVDVSDILVAGATGAITGGVGGRLAVAASEGVISTKAAISLTTATGAGVGGAGTATQSALNGESQSLTKNLAGAAGGATGAAIGSKTATGFAKTLEKGFGGLNSHVTSATRQGMIGDTVAAGTTGLEKSMEIGAEAASNLLQKQIEDK